MTAIGALLLLTWLLEGVSAAVEDASDEADSLWPEPGQRFYMEVPAPVGSRVAMGVYGVPR